MIDRRKLLALLASSAVPGTLWAAESDLFKEAVAEGSMPSMAQRLPKNPRVINLSAMGREPGRSGGTVRLLVGRQKDIRLMQMNSYSRLVGYDENLDLQPIFWKATPSKRGGYLRSSCAKGTAGPMAVHSHRKISAMSTTMLKTISSSVAAGRQQI